MTPAYVSPQQPADEYLDLIDSVEAEYGAYATELSDLYLGLGQTMLKAGEFDKALDAFHRGVLVQRVNLGPNSPEQTNHLFLLANIEYALGDWKAANEVFKNIYFINSNHYGEDSAEILPILNRMYQWYIATRPPGSDQSDFEDHDRLIDITDEMVRISEAAEGVSNLEIANAYRRHGEAHFQMMLWIRGYEMALKNDRYLAVSNDARFPLDTATDNYYDGRRAFEMYQEYLLKDESLTPPQYAQALAEVGDWFLLAERYERSRDFYEKGYQVLQESGRYADEVDRYMKHPAPMHFVEMPGNILTRDMPPAQQNEWLDISLTVTESGKLRSIEVLDAPEDLSKSDIRTIRRHVQEIPFRPAIKEGKVVRTEDFIWRYRMTPKEEAS